MEQFGFQYSFIGQKDFIKNVHVYTISLPDFSKKFKGHVLDIQHKKS